MELKIYLQRAKYKLTSLMLYESFYNQERVKKERAQRWPNLIIGKRRRGPGRDDMISDLSS